MPAKGEAVTRLTLNTDVMFFKWPCRLSITCLMIHITLLFLDITQHSSSVSDYRFKSHRPQLVMCLGFTVKI